MKKTLILLIGALLLAACSTIRYVEVPKYHHDSTYVSNSRLDSLYRAAFQKDSVYKHDSVYVYQKGDTVTKYVEKVTYQYKLQRDTLYRDRIRRDTMYVERVDSVTVVQHEVVEKPIKWYNQGFIWVGRLCCLALIFWALFLYLKRKF